MRTLTMLAAFALATPAWADDCKGGKLIEDAYSGAKSVRFKSGYPSGAKPRETRLFRAEIEVTSSGATLMLELVQGGAMNGVIEPGAPLGLRLGDGTKIEVVTATQSPMTPDVSGSQIFTTLTMTFPLTAEHVGQLAASPIAAIAVGLPNGPEVYELTGKAGKRFSEAWTCGASLIGG